MLHYIILTYIFEEETQSKQQNLIISIYIFRHSKIKKIFVYKLKWTDKCFEKDWYIGNALEFYLK